MPLPNNIAPELRIVPDEALAELRAIEEANLPHFCTASIDVKTGTRVGGALTSGPTQLFANVPCRLTALKSRAGLALIADQSDQIDPWVVTFRIGIELPLGALLTITGVDALGAAWTRLVRAGPPTHSRTAEICSRYSARDVSPALR